MEQLVGKKMCFILIVLKKVFSHKFSLFDPIYSRLNVFSFHYFFLTLVSTLSIPELLEHTFSYVNSYWE